MARKEQAANQLVDNAARLYDVRQAAAYLGVGVWTVRDLIHSGHLPRIALPSVRRGGEPMRRILVDRADLDQLIERFREVAQPDVTELGDRVLARSLTRARP